MLHRNPLLRFALYVRCLVLGHQPRERWGYVSVTATDSNRVIKQYHYLACGRCGALINVPTQAR